jgi:hypothetical protein
MRSSAASDVYRDRLGSLADAFARSAGGTG